MREGWSGKAVSRGLLVAMASLQAVHYAHSQPLKSARMEATHKLLVVGFVGGFVRHDDAKHAEVQFAARLRQHYASAIDVEVFGNHSGEKALRHILQLLDADGDSVLTAEERAQARIVIFGHSWGGTETVLLARALERRGIPVILTVQVDSIAKPGQGDVSVPGNVRSAVNFYQSNGLLHGRSKIVAADPEHTKIIGNFRMTYEDHPVDCDGFPWYARIFTKPHIEIENDPRVWDQVASLIETEVSKHTPQKASLLADTPITR